MESINRVLFGNYTNNEEQEITNGEEQLTILNGLKDEGN